MWRFETNGGVRAIRAYTDTQTGQTRILIGSIDGYLYLLNGQGNLLDKYQIKHPIHAVFAADIDHDGYTEILIASDDHALTALVYAQQENMSTESCKGTFAKKWRRDFGSRLISLCVADVDHDGKMEIFASAEDKCIYILDEEGTIIWQHYQKYRVFSIALADVDKDGLPELVIGTEDNHIRAMRIRLRKGIEQSIRRYYRLLGEPDPTEIADLTNDERTLLQNILHKGEQELVTLQQAQAWLAYEKYDQALATLLKLKQQKVERVWQKETLGHVRTLCLRHTANETKQEIIVGTLDNIYAYTSSGRRMWSSFLNDYIVDVQTGFIDHHRQEEIVICSSDQHIYILTGTKKLHQSMIDNDDMRMSSICVTAPNTQNTAEIIVGSSDKKLYIYGNGNLQKPSETKSIPEGVKIVRAHAPLASGEAMPEIVVAGQGNCVYAYARNGQKPLWVYEARDTIRSLVIKDINHDGKLEVLIGSEDRNLHVVDNAGHLLWRYYLPHSILSIDTIDIDHDENAEIFVGCADSCLYVFRQDGTMQWTYQAQDRIHAMLVEDIDADSQIEIVLGTENEVELLRIVSQSQLDELIARCWSALRRQSNDRQEIKTLFNSNNPYLQIFALNKLIELADCSSKDFDYLERGIKEGSVAVRKAVVRAVMHLYPLNPVQARKLLSLLWADSESDIKSALIEHADVLIQHDWEHGSFYLAHVFEGETINRYTRRLAIRKLHQLIDTSQERAEEIFRLLLAAAQNKESEWVQQEAAHALAHFLSQPHDNLIIYIHLFIVKNIKMNIWRDIAYAITAPTVKRFVNAVIPLLGGLDEENATRRLRQVVKTMAEISDRNYGQALFLLYSELYHLFTFETIEEIAHYQCALRKSQFDEHNKFAPIILSIFNELSLISRPLKAYIWREHVQDRLTSLLEALEAIERVYAFIGKQYTTLLMKEPISRLPDRQVFVLLLEKWRKFVQTQLNDLRGKAELAMELLTKDVRYEEQVGIWLTIKNVGRSSANEVKITLWHNETFDIIGNNTFESELLLSEDERTFEFTLRPKCKDLKLKFDKMYVDIDGDTKIEVLEVCLSLNEMRQDYRYIKNPYSSGIPTHDRTMFYGREKDMEFVLNHLVSAARNVIVLYGQRRSGKTTMLLQLRHSPALENAIAVLIDLQNMSYDMDAIDKFLHRIAYFIVKDVKAKGICLTQPELSSFAVNPTHTFDVFLDQVEEQLGERKLILLVDEFEILEEQVTKHFLKAEIFEYLRNIVQHRQYISFLFSGTHKITQHTKWYHSVFFHIARHHRLSRLDPQGAEDLIQKPVAGFLEYEPHALTKIRQLTADQPYLIHLLCGAIVEYCNDQKKTFVAINDVNAALDEVTKTSNFHFDWIWKQIQPEVRVALAAIAEGGKEDGRWLSFSEIEELYRHYQILSKRDYIQDALKTLIDADIIEDMQASSQGAALDNSRFRIPVGLTRSWLLREHPLALVSKEMRD